MNLNLLLNNNWFFLIYIINFLFLFFKFLEKSAIGQIKYIFKENNKLTLVYCFFSKLTQLFLFPIFLFIFFLKNRINLEIFNELSLNNDEFMTINLVTFFSLIILKNIIIIKEISYNILINFLLVIGFILCSNLFLIKSLFNNYLFLEMLNLIIFLIIINNINIIKKYRDNKIQKNIKNATNNSYSSYFYSIFLYFWITFLFSFIYSFLLIIILKIFNISNLEFLNFIVETNKNQTNIWIIGLIILLSFLIKLGLPPIFFIKLEIYKNLKITLSLLYSILLIFFFFFIYLKILNELIVFIIQLKTSFILISLILLILLLINIYKETNLRKFLSYSSTININIIFIYYIYNL